ncbi:hypothetical protein OG455_28985 [Kitasatospora sp. NBC_01287]|uniref:hypothetical protein n=1 Tax=Kitasatospora sp. NBC_01287 TaxID=2903573 RepID=UPI00225BEBC0|nr:hypothetical protein [Kitasatospora sp. NBC_01287]MCX4749498.1 hypothetical protein [Kitasatospora sp. NBC_01287]
MAQRATEVLARHAYAFRVRLARVVIGMSTDHQIHTLSRENTTPLVSAPAMALPAL